MYFNETLRVGGEHVTAECIGNVQIHWKHEEIAKHRYS